MGNAAGKRAAAARHNARYEQRDAVRPNLTKASRFEGVNVGAIGEVDGGMTRKPLVGTLSLTWEERESSWVTQIKPPKKPSLFQRFAAYLKNKLIGR
ncbi:hypothetical protein G3495_23340 [Shewanella baltica]|uniref:hypothetical protein n=1 Tax=Shewanella baltica TaxID=62322 RepID=UPI00217E3270|nr:hypothetical protein [Shewanella baltica]MCS6237994.1 hypothetical protein [Shewanella baltica]MCS6270901.1 hypothetical protein [Shewanella baltica]